MSLTPGEPPPTVIINNAAAPAADLPVAVRDSLLAYAENYERSARYARERQHQHEDIALTARRDAEAYEVAAASLRTYLGAHGVPADAAAPEPAL